MTHLGTLVSALADDQLSPATRERALTHVAGCDQCAAELAVARAVRKRLSCARDV
ncbi:anti-sigma factor, partial [Actinotalea fermentans ATCC 43279 = JCM 9966 = DSM 3133]